ncbi:MAG: mannitol dehydrogenase family protein [Pseudomonadota bacterium]
MDELIRLSNATLPELPTAILRPTYDRSQLTPGIVHIGLGNFHRAHQSWYLHRLMQEGKAHDFAIVGAGVRDGDRAMRARLVAQDCLTTLIELAPDAASAEVVGSMIDFVPVSRDNQPLIGALMMPEIRIAALTVTEGGYYLTADNGFDGDHPDMVHDSANPQAPITAFGAIVAALRARRAAGGAPLTVQSCDNLQGNGALVRQTVVSLARLSDPDLSAWIEDNVSFPNAMVDCIVPATGRKEIEMAERFGIADPAPVTHENFRQWVIEDDFCAGRPEWEAAGATFTNDVHAYEMMKLRVLNAGHQVLANAGEVLSLATISDCMRSPLVAGLFRKVQQTEILPNVDPVPGMTPAQYLELIERRFSNGAIGDTVRRVAFDGSARHTGFVLPVLRAQLKAGGGVGGLALVEALWARMCTGERDDGSTIEPNDPHWARLQTAAWAARERPEAWLEQPEIYGDLKDAASFRDAFVRWLTQIHSSGAESALTAYRQS